MRLVAERIVQLIGRCYVLRAWWQWMQDGRVHDVMSLDEQKYTNSFDWANPFLSLLFIPNLNDSEFLLQN